MLLLINNLILINYVKYEICSFMENAEKIRDLIDLSIRHNSNMNNNEIKYLWKTELVQMQEQTSSYHMYISMYYRNRSEIGTNILEQPQISDHWQQIIEIDEDCFFKLREILVNLRLFNLRLYRIVYQCIYSSNKIMQIYDLCLYDLFEKKNHVVNFISTDKSFWNGIRHR